MGPLESPDGRAVDPVVGVVAIVGLAVVCSAAIGTVLIGTGGGLEGGATPTATVEIETLVQDDTDGFVTVGLGSLSDADAVTVTATTADGARSIADGAGNATAELTDRSEAAGDSVTFREAADAPRDTELRLVARAHGADERTVVFDRTVIV